MKTFLTLLTLAFSSAAMYAQNEAPQAQQQQVKSIRWYTDYQSALKAAQEGPKPSPSSGVQMAQKDRTAAQKMEQKDRKPILLYFTGSDWCGWCKKMDNEIFSSPEFISEVGSKFIFVKLDFPMNQKLPENEMQQNAQLKQRYGVTGYPTVVIIDASGGFLGQTGYRSGGGKAYATYLQSFLEK